MPNSDLFYGGPLGIFSLQRFLAQRLERTFSTLFSTLHATVPVLDSVVAPAFQRPGYLSPLVTLPGDQIENDITFLPGDGVVVEPRIQVLMPALTTLFW
ncbi:hypothetical protein E4U31_005373 [Claviceps sp. LM219 group G6]|nr:hypothetical protein E4U31_005373 [Claviceps sp. LM219 group G6]